MTDAGDTERVDAERVDAERVDADHAESDQPDVAKQDVERVSPAAAGDDSLTDRFWRADGWTQVGIASAAFLLVFFGALVVISYV